MSWLSNDRLVHALIAATVTTSLASSAIAAGSAAQSTTQTETKSTNTTSSTKAESMNNLKTKPAKTHNDASLPLSLAATSRSEEGWMAKHDALVESAHRGGVGILFLGDSITEGMNRDIMHRLFGADSANFGISGDRTQNQLWRIRNGELDFSKPQPKAVVILMGTNNLSDWGDKMATNGEVVQGVKANVSEIRKHLPDAKILIIGILPREQSPTHELRTRIKRVNARLKALADKKHVYYVDIGPSLTQPDGTISKEVMEDFLHPTSQVGYEKMFTALKPPVDAMLAGK